MTKNSFQKIRNFQETTDIFKIVATKLFLVSLWFIMITLIKFMNDLFQFIILKTELLIRKSVDTNCRFLVKTCLMTFKMNTTNRYYIMSVTSHCKRVFFFPIENITSYKKLSGPLILMQIHLEQLKLSLCIWIQAMEKKLH